MELLDSIERQSKEIEKLLWKKGGKMASVASLVTIYGLISCRFDRCILTEVFLCC